MNTDNLFFILVFLLIVLFAGEPDIQDAIVQFLTKGKL